MGNAFPPSDDSEPDDDGEEEEELTFKDLLNILSREWLHTQLTHHVSLVACEEFWRLSLEFLPRIMHLKNLERNKKKIPQFQQVRI